MASRLASVLAAAFAVVSLAVSPVFAQATASYTYDALGRVITSTTAAGVTTYTYDNADNRTHLTSVVTGGNQNPVANADTATVAAGGTVTIPVLANDTDPDSNPLTVSNVGGSPTKGTPSVTSGSGSVTYVAGAGQSGTDTFNYTISDGHGGSAQANVTVTITAVVPPPIAGSVSASVGYQSGANGVSPNLSGGPATFVSITGSPSKGTASASGLGMTYTPGAAQTGQDTFSYNATGPGGTSSSATVSITIGAAPVPPPIAGPVSATVTNGSGANAISPNLSGGTASSVAIVSGPSSGSASASGLTMSYTPAATGVYTFQYNATGPGGTSSAATVTVTVNPASTPLTGATVSSTSFERFWTGTTWSGVSAIVCAPVGGVGPFSYAWEYVSGDTGFLVAGGSSASASWSKTYNNVHVTYVAQWRCKVTDANLAVAYSPEVTVTLDQNTN